MIKPETLSVPLTPNNRASLHPARWTRILHTLYARPTSAIGTTVVFFFVLMALLGPWLAPYGGTEQIAGVARQAPSLKHIFGTDHLGRDVFSRVLIGARDIFALAGVGTLLAVVLGTITG